MSSRTKTSPRSAATPIGSSSAPASASAATRRRKCRPATWPSPRPSGASKRPTSIAAESTCSCLATLSPDYLLPATAAAVQDRLGLNCAAMDVSAACAGFMYALVTGMQFVATGSSKFALVIGADTNSRVMNPDDKKTYPAVRRRRRRRARYARAAPSKGLLSYTLGADGSGEQLLDSPGRRLARAARRPATGRRRLVRENGRPAGVQVGRAAARRFVAASARRGRLQDVGRRSCGCSTRPTFASSTRPPMRWRSIAAKSKRTSTATATPRPAACRSRSTKRSAPAASAAATCCSCAASAAASPGAPH